MRLVLSGTCAAALALAACGSAEAGLAYVSQDRHVHGHAGTSDFPPTSGVLAQDSEAAADFDDFDAVAEVFYEDTSDGDDNKARASQRSTLRETGFTARGAVYASGDDRSVARTLFSVVFDATEDLDYSLSLAADYPNFQAFFDTQLVRFRFARVEDDRGETVLAEDIITPDDLEGPDYGAFGLDQTGRLEAGRYSFDLDVRAGNVIGTFEEGTYDLDFTTTAVDDGGAGGGPNPIPLPPAAWAGLITFAGYGAIRTLGKRLRRA